MKFASHLTSHLTPEWRKQYIDYEGLKKMVYKMVGQEEVEDPEGEDNLSGSLGSTQRVLFVDEVIQDEFFELISKQLENVNSFFQAREAESSHKLRDLGEQVEVLQALRGNRRTRPLRSTRNKHHSLKLAMTEFYYNLVLLQNFQQLNHTGFRKVLKKQDKLARSEKGMAFFKNQVCQAYFWKSNKLSDLIATTEGLMIDKLEDGNRSKAMNRLRVPPLEARDVRSHWVTLIAGCLMGALVVLVVVAIVLAVLHSQDSWDIVNPVLRGLRVGFILTLWFYAFAINTFGWRKAGVNNILIFELDPRNNLNFVELFAIASFLGVLFMLGVFLTLFSYMLHYPAWVGPLVMMGLMGILFALPLPILYHRSRLWLAKICGRILLAPIFHVNFADFWIADQMNSLVIVLLDLEYFWCYMIYGLHFPDMPIQCGSVKYGLRSFIAVLPAWFRFFQCLRRYHETREVFPHLVNAGKYSTSFFVVFFSSVSAGIKEPSQSLDSQGPVFYLFFVLWIVAAIVSTCYTFTWDVKMDWGLFQGKYKLREELIYPSKVYYYLAIAEDLIFRSLWTFNISVGEAGANILKGNILGTILAVMEVFRRFVWNYFRLENEHLNNCGQFRVVRDIAIYPLNPSEVNLNDEDGVEPMLRRHLQAVQRNLSMQHTELHGNLTSSGAGPTNRFSSRDKKELCSSRGLRQLVKQEDERGLEQASSC